MSLAPLVPLFLGLGFQVDRSERLNGPLLSYLAPGDVERFAVSPDGSWALYLAPQDSATPGLYAVSTDGSRDAQLLSPPGATVGPFAISATGSRAVFQAGPDLYRVGTSGAVVQLNPPLPVGASVLEFVLSPDGQRALYRADQEVAGRVDLYSVNLTSTPQSVRLSRATLASGDVDTHWIVPGGARVVFGGDLRVDALTELYSAPIDGSQPDVPLSGTFVAGGAVNVFSSAPSADGARVLYLADALVDGKFELFSAPVDGSAAPVRLSGALQSFGDVGNFLAAPVGGGVAFTADALVDERPELYSVPADGSAPAIQLNGAVRPVTGFVFAHTGQTIVFRDQFGGALSNQLWSVPTDGSAAPLQLSNHPLNSRGILQFSVTLDSAAALYVLSFGSSRKLWRVPLDGSAAPAEILAPAGTEVVTYHYAPDGLTLVLLSESTTSGARVLSVAPVDGSGPTLALHVSSSALLGPGDDLRAVGDQVYFRADLLRREVFELFGVPLDASQAPRLLSDDPFVAPLVTDVTSFALSADGQRLAYTTGLGAFSLELAPPNLTRNLMSSHVFGAGSYGSMRFTLDGNRLFWVGPGAGYHVFSAPFDASQPTVQLSSGVFAQGFGAFFPRFSPDGSRYVFQYGTYFGPGAIYTGPTDLATPPVVLSGASIQGLTYLGSEVVYAHTPYNPYYPETTRFYRQPADASAPRVELVPAPVNWPASGALAVTPDGARVLYVRDDESQGRYELYSLALTPGAQPVELSEPLPSGRRVLSLLVPTPDSTRVLFLADRDEADQYELYVVPVDGSAPPLELSGTLVSGGDVSVLFSQVKQNVWVTPDSTRVLYLADALVNDRYDLYSAPLDGSQPPTVLAAAPFPGGNVDTETGSVQLTPGATRAVLRGDLVVDSRIELFSVPVAGGALVRLGAPLVAGGNVSLPFLVRADGTVLYHADLEVNERFELWLAPADRPGRSLRRSFLAHAQGDVETDFAVDAAGKWVYYRADAQVDQEVELFRHPLHPTPLVKRR